MKRASYSLILAAAVLMAVIGSHVVGAQSSTIGEAVSYWNNGAKSVTGGGVTLLTTPGLFANRYNLMGKVVLVNGSGSTATVTCNITHNSGASDNATLTIPGNGRAEATMMFVTASSAGEQVFLNCQVLSGSSITAEMMKIHTLSVTSGSTNVFRP